MVETDYLSEADKELQEYKEAPMSLEEYVERLQENPESASQAAKYMLEAIEHEGTRTVVEEGEEVERYRFFDDPHNDGEHAILGNTKVLNEFVEDIRSIASGRGKQEKMILVSGPTATGKSELKRNLINGLREYSKTDEGRRYMLEWNAAEGEDEQWYESPVQEEPLKLLPQETRQRLLDDLNDMSDDNIDIVVEGQPDPFSRKHYRILEEVYLDKEDDEELFRSITGKDNVRIKRFLMDKGRGIGVLRSEDEGDAKEKLVGEWMPGMITDLESLGEKDPRAHSYDGIAAQGHRGLAIIEEGGHHRELIEKMLNVTEENSAKLDKDIEMDLDTIFLLISNPDLQEEMRKEEEKEELDPLKPLRRRLEKHEFKYLTNYSLENDLIRKLLTGRENIWSEDIDYDDILEEIREPLTMEVRDNKEQVHEKEFAPHAIEAAALYDVVTRIDDGFHLRADEDYDLEDDEFDVVDKALLYDRGKIEREGHVLERDEFDVGLEEEGTKGIPVTYTKDVLADLLYADLGRNHEELNVEEVILPQDVLERMANDMGDAEVFSESEIDAEDGFPALQGVVEEYILDLQERDVLDAIMSGKEVSEEEVERYVQNVVADLSERPVDVGIDEPDNVFMKSFETMTLGKFDDTDYAYDRGQPHVKEFRREEILEEVSEQYLIKAKEESDPDIDVLEIPVLNSLLGTHSWEDVARFYDNFDPAQWEDPLAGTDTEEVKERAIEKMQEMFGYSEASAELTSRRVMERAEVALHEE